MFLNKKNQSGFSLLEVLVAFSLFAVSFSILLQIYSKGTSSARLTDEYATAVIIAQSSMARIGIESFPEDGFIEETQGKYQISISINEIVDDESFDAFTQQATFSKRDILLNVSWEHKGKSHSIQFNTMKLFPTT